MTYADVVSQMQQIQSVLAQLQSTPTTATSATSASDFASALNGATTSASGTSGTANATEGALVTGTGATGGDIVAAAKAYVGTPYVLGGESKSGIDCSGLVQAAFKDSGVGVPRLVHQQETIGQRVDSLKDAQPGDLIVLNGGDHIAIYAGNDTVIHAPYAGRTVSVQKAWFDDSDIVTIRRVVPSTADTQAAGTTDAAAAVSGTSSTLSAATVARATALMTMYGMTGGDSSSTSGSSMLSGLLGTGTGTGAALGATADAGASTSTTAQLFAARAAALGAAS